MATPMTIDQARREGGEKLLRMTDEAGFSAQGAGWFYESATETWWYLLVTPMIDSKGPKWIYERLLRLFQRWPLPASITPLDIRIASPREQFFRNFPIKAQNNIPGGAMPQLELVQNMLNGIFVDYALIYRMNITMQHAAEVAHRFDRKIKELEAA